MPDMIRFVVGVGVLLVVLAAPAAAHTELASAVPAEGATVESVGAIELRFTEDIELELAHVYLQDDAGIVELGPLASIGGDHGSLTVPVPPIGDGTYVVTWHVVAADATPAQGTVSFTVEGSVPAVAAPAVPSDPAADPPPDTSLAVAVDDFGRPITIPSIPDHGHGPGDLTRGVARGLLDASLATLIGGLAFVGAVWPQGARLARTRLVLWSAAILATLASFELAAFQHAAATGMSTLEAFSPAHQWDALQFRYGRLTAARVVLLGLSAFLTARLVRGGARTARSASWWLAATALALGLIETLVLLSHSSTPGILATGARLLHVLGVSVWLGGLVMLCCVVLPRRRADELLAVLPRFSSVVTGAVAVLTVGGLLLAVDLVGSVAAMPTTGYGRALLAKVVVVGVLLSVASVSRERVRLALRPKAEPLTTSGLRPLVLWVGTEVGLMAAVFGLTAFLVSQAPPG
jgi:putative copper export protein/methionine-rich copper-binding protein CopC